MLELRKAGQREVTPQYLRAPLHHMGDMNTKPCTFGDSNRLSLMQIYRTLGSGQPEER